MRFYPVLPSLHSRHTGNSTRLQEFKILRIKTINDCQRRKRKLIPFLQNDCSFRILVRHLYRFITCIRSFSLQRWITPDDPKIISPPNFSILSTNVWLYRHPPNSYEQARETLQFFIRKRRRNSPSQFRFRITYCPLIQRIQI